MGKQTNGAAAAATATTPKSARVHSKAAAVYPFTGVDSTGYAARVIGVRHRLSPSVAQVVAGLLGMGGGK